jgi:hypothetical protein
MNFNGAFPLTNVLGTFTNATGPWYSEIMFTFVSQGTIRWICTFLGDNVRDVNQGLGQNIQLASPISFDLTIASTATGLTSPNNTIVVSYLTLTRIF